MTASQVIAVATAHGVVCKADVSDGRWFGRRVVVVDTQIDDTCLVKLHGDFFEAVVDWYV